MKPLTDKELRDLFSSFLDDCYETFSIGIYSYPPSQVLESVDPIVFNEEFNNWLNSMVTEGDLEERSPGEYFWVANKED